MLVFVFLILFSFDSFASIKRYHSEAGTLRIAEFYHESGTWNIDVFRVDRGRMQVLESRHTSQHEQSVRQLWRETYQNGWSSRAPIAQPYANTESKSEVLWEVRNHWSEDWEQRFYDWVDSEFNKDFFAQYEIATDCADAAIALRWIFARMHGLPVGNHLAGSGVLMTQDSVRRSWLELPTAEAWHRDKRFRAALDYIADNAYTHTLFRDTYPVAITRESLRAGTILIELHTTSGHTRIISETNYQDSSKFPAVLLSSTVPRTIRSLYEEPFIGLNSTVPDKSGLRQMRWIVDNGQGWEMAPAEKGLYYSLEQYDPSYQSNFTGRIYEVLDVEVDPSLIARSVVEDLKRSVEERIRVVQEGFVFCSQTDCVPGTQAWEDWSTPSRDKRFVDKATRFWSLMRHLGAPQVTQWALDQFERVSWDIEGGQLSLRQIEYLLTEKLASSDPEMTIARRWGTQPEAIAENIQARFLNLWAERISRSPERAGPSCESYCSFTSEEFHEKNTLQIDLKLRDLVFTKMSMKTGLGEDMAALVQEELRRLEVLPYRFSMAEALKRIPLLSADPNAPRAERWATQPSPYRIFSRFTESNFSVVGPWVLQGRSFSPLADEENVLKSGLISTNPYNSTYPFFRIDSREKMIEVFDTGLAAWKTFEVEFDFFYGSMLIDNLALMWVDGAVHLVEMVGGKVVIRESFDRGSTMSLSSDIFWVQRGERSFVLWLQLNQMKRLEVEIGNNLEIANWKVSKNWLFQVQQTSVQLIHAKKGGQVVNIETGNSYWDAKFIAENTFALIGNSSLLIQLQDDGEILWQQELDGYWQSSARYGNELYALVTREHPTLFRIEEHGLVEIPNRRGHYFSGLGSNYILSYNLDAKAFYIQKSIDGTKKALPLGHGYWIQKGSHGEDEISVQSIDALAGEAPILIFRPEQLWSGRPRLKYSYSLQTSQSISFGPGGRSHIDRGQILPFGREWQIWLESL